jgi:ABC-type phosphate transport system substrate-binding protein
MAATMRTSLLALLLALALPARAADPDGFKLVVHPSNKAAKDLTRSQVSQLFLKKTTRWADARRVLPVEPADLELREKFARRIHNKSATAVKSFWNQQIFAGREVPPIEKSTDAEVVAYVRSNPEAIGYVAAGADLAGVLVIAPRD